MKGWDGPVAGEQTAWADGCPLLDATSSVLTAAQLIHPPTFSYFEAMSAVQLMDPQMDAGLSHGDDSGATVEELVVTGRAPLALSPRALLSVLGRLTACEATWHSGHSLAQTLFTCLYMHDHARTRQNLLLGALMDAVRASARIVQDLVCTAGVAEEEDFVGATFNLPLADVGDDGVPISVATQATKALDGLHTAEEWLRSCAPGGGAAATLWVGSEAEPLHGFSQALGAAEADALLAHVRLRTALLNALVALDQGGKHLKAAERYLEMASAQVEVVRGLWTQTGEAGDEQPGAREGGEKSHEKCDEVELGFDVWVNQRLLAPTPPRRIKLLTWAEACAHLATLARHLLHVTAIARCGSLHEILRRMEHLGYTYPSVVARSCLSSMLLKPKSLLGRAPWPHVVKEAVWLSPGDLEGVEAVDGLIEHATEVLEFTMRSLCASPGRLRRKLRHLIDHWAGLCNVAEDLDMSDVMILHLALGFKLGLYAEREFLMIYWYIEYVQTSLLDNLTQAAKSLADGFAADHAAATAAAAVDDAKPQKASPLGKKKGKGKGEQGTAGPGAGADVKAAVVPWSPAQQQLALEIAEVEAQQSMCRGYVRMLAGLSVQGLLKLAGGPTDAAASHALPQFNTLAQVYEQRFAMMHISPYPAALHFQDYTTSMDTSKFNPLQLYTADKVLQALGGGPETTQDCDRSRELKELSKAALTNLVALKVVVNAASPTELEVALDFTVHRTFATIKVKRVAKP